MYTGLGRAPALHYAVENGQVETAKLLRKAGMDTGIENEVHEDCRTAFDCVLMSQHNPIAPSRMRSGKSSTQTPAFGATSCWPTCGQHGRPVASMAIQKLLTPSAQEPQVLILAATLGCCHWTSW